MIYSKLSNLISSHIDIKEEEMDLIKSFFKYESAAKGAFLIEVGCFTDKVFFILSGYLKYFKMTDAGDEVVIHLYASSFCNFIEQFFFRKKSEEKLQAITDCEYLYISRSDLEKLFSINQAWQSFGRKMMESFLIEKEERIIDSYL
jgi:cAMP-binding proteins - catabolite gene activator and regulatory subunit of cAMP-dependent protein kinases